MVGLGASWYRRAVIPRRLAPSLVALPLLSALALPLSGCYADIESFAEKGAKHWCTRLENCNRSAFEDLYDGDMERCRSDVHEAILDFDDTKEDLGCTYDAEDGKRCIQSARKVRNDCSDDADALMLDDCYGDPISAAVSAPNEIYACGG